MIINLTMFYVPDWFLYTMAVIVSVCIIKTIYDLECLKRRSIKTLKGGC